MLQKYFSIQNAKDDGPETKIKFHLCHSLILYWFKRIPKFNKSGIFNCILLQLQSKDI